jgi:methyl-accepting chemotaxis protein
MSARKIKPPKSTSSDARAFAVVLEEIRAQNKVFGEGQQLLREQMAAGFEEVNRRFEQVDDRFQQVDRHFEHIEQDVAELRQDVGLVKIAVLEHSRGLKEIRVGLDKKVDRDEAEEMVQRVVSSGR